MDWLAKLLGLPEVFLSKTLDGAPTGGGGVIQGTASEATLCTLLAARSRCLAPLTPQDQARLVAYSSDQV